MSHRQLQKLSVYKNEPLAKKRELFTKTLLPNHPSVLGDWFRLTFPDAQVEIISKCYSIMYLLYVFLELVCGSHRLHPHNGRNVNGWLHSWLRRPSRPKYSS